jgi:hypothetical protein
MAYELTPSLGLWLISQGNAEEIRPSAATMVVPLDNPFAFEQLTRGIQVSQPMAEAADSSRRLKRNRKKR